MQHICRELANKKRKFTKGRCFAQLNIKNTHTHKKTPTKPNNWKCTDSYIIGICATTTCKSLAQILVLNYNKPTVITSCISTETDPMNAEFK